MLLVTTGYCARRGSLRMEARPQRLPPARLTDVSMSFAISFPSQPMCCHKMLGFDAISCLLGVGVSVLSSSQQGTYLE